VRADGQAGRPCTGAVLALDRRFLDVCPVMACLALYRRTHAGESASRRRHVCVVPGSEVGSACDGSAADAIRRCCRHLVRAGGTGGAKPSSCAARVHVGSMAPHREGSHGWLDASARGPSFLVWACPPAANRGRRDSGEVHAPGETVGRPGRRRSSPFTRVKVRSHLLNGWIVVTVEWNPRPRVCYVSARLCRAVSCTYQAGRVARRPNKRIGLPMGDN